MVSFEMNDLKKIGLGLTGFGVFFSFLGIVFFFDKGLIAMGNILFLSGLGLTIGLKSTLQFFTKPKNYKGTISFGVGFFLVLIGWPFFVDSGQLLLSSCKGFPFLAGFFNNHLSHRSLTATEENEFRCSIFSSHVSYGVATEFLLSGGRQQMVMTVCGLFPLPVYLLVGLFFVNYNTKSPPNGCVKDQDANSPMKWIEETFGKIWLLRMLLKEITCPVSFVLMSASDRHTSLVILCLLCFYKVLIV